MTVRISRQVTAAVADGKFDRTEYQALMAIVNADRKVSTRELPALRKTLIEHGAKFEPADRQALEVLVANQLKTARAKVSFFKQLGYVKEGRVGASELQRDGMTFKSVLAMGYVNKAGEHLYLSDTGLVSSTKIFKPYGERPVIWTPR